MILARHETRIARNESRIARNESSIARNEFRITRNKPRLARKESRLTSNETRDGNLSLSGTFQEGHGIKKKGSGRSSDYQCGFIIY